MERMATTIECGWVGFLVAGEDRGGKFGCELEVCKSSKYWKLSQRLLVEPGMQPSGR